MPLRSGEVASWERMGPRARMLGAMKGDSRGMASAERGGEGGGGAGEGMSRQGRGRPGAAAAHATPAHAHQAHAAATTRAAAAPAALRSQPVQPQPPHHSQQELVLGAGGVVDNLSWSCRQPFRNQVQSRSVIANKPERLSPVAGRLLYDMRTLPELTIG